MFTESFPRKKKNICDRTTGKIIILGYFNILIELKITRIFHSDVLNLVTSVEQIYYTGAIRDVKMGKVVQVVVRVQDRRIGVVRSQID